MAGQICLMLKMNVVLLSGGSGKLLWPLSNDVRSKQFIRLFRRDMEAGLEKGADGDGGYESMMQRVFRQVRRVAPEARVTAVSAKSQVSAIRNQLGGDVGICVEPCRRDTFPAVVLATAYLHDVLRVSLDEAVVVCPVDPYTDGSYYAALKQVYDLAARGDCSLTLLGVEPTYPSSLYGYIVPETAEKVSRVRSFKEKPSEAVAEECIRSGALWNGGVFGCRLGYVLDKARELLDFTDYDDLFARYESLAKISFDYAVAEHELSCQVVRYRGKWLDIGTWNALTEVMSERVIGKAMLNDGCENVHVLNELDMPILCMGLKNAVVSASPAGILVADKRASSYIQPFVEKFAGEVMFAEKSWGEYRVIDIGEDSLTAKIVIHAGQRMNYHSHEHRDEVWTVVTGEGVVVVDGLEQEVRDGDVITMEAGCRHTVIAKTELKLIEVQLGKAISVHDKQKFSRE